MDEGSLVRRFIDADLQLTQDALQKLRVRENAQEAVDLVLSVLKADKNKPFLITTEIISEILESGVRKTKLAPAQMLEQIERVEEPEPTVKPERLGELTFRKFKPIAAEYEERTKILQDVTGKLDP